MLRHARIQTGTRDVRIVKGTSLNQVKPVRVLDTPVKEKFFYSLIEQAEE